MLKSNVMSLHYTHLFYFCAKLWDLANAQNMTSFKEKTMENFYFPIITCFEFFLLSRDQLQICLEVFNGINMLLDGISKHRSKIELVQEEKRRIEAKSLTRESH